ncbi:alpha/beta fold hydrolase [Streptomyces sp. NPDC058623]|uniref:alpha/beta fold hydrolase n=1 Tax=Streptomyces sp. NPDC058623 TaxID=3346563 RepID=UPI0036525514
MTATPAALIPEGEASALAFVLAFPYVARTREELLVALGPAAPVLGGALRPLPDGGRRLPFHPQDTVTSETAVHGDHWAQWLAAPCPALLLRGTASQVLSAEHAAEMTARRPRTTHETLDADHFLQLRDPEGGPRRRTPLPRPSLTARPQARAGLAAARLGSASDRPPAHHRLRYPCPGIAPGGCCRGGPMVGPRRHHRGSTPC